VSRVADRGEAVVLIPHTGRHDCEALAAFRASLDAFLAALPSASPDEVRAVEAFESANARPRVRRVISARRARLRADECPACEGSGGRLLDDWGYERDDCRACGGTGLRTVLP